MGAKNPTDERWPQVVPPIESIAGWTTGFAESARALLLADRAGSQGWPSSNEHWEGDN